VLLALEHIFLFNVTAIAGTTVLLAIRPDATSVQWADTGNAILQNPDYGTSHLKSIFAFCPCKSWSTLLGQDWPPSSEKEMGRGRGGLLSWGQ